MRTDSQILNSCGACPKPTSGESPAKAIEADNGYDAALSDADARSTSGQSVGAPPSYTPFLCSPFDFVQPDAQPNHDFHQLLHEQGRAEFVHGF